MFNLYCSFGQAYSLAQKRPAAKLVISFPGAGCQWKREHSCCVMCGFTEATQRFSQGFLLPGIFFKVLYSLAINKYKNAEELAIFNGGSYFNGNEVPEDFRYWLLARAAKNKSLKEIFVESRCEYLEEDVLRKAGSIVQGKRLVVGVGLESQSDYVRNVLIRKGLDKGLFEEKIALLFELGIVPSVYIFLKPPVLSEKESFEDVLSSIEYVLGLDVKRIELSCAFIQRNTLLESLYREGIYSLPKLWTILELIKIIVKNNWPVQVGKFSDWPLPIAIPENCDKCSAAVYKIIDEFRLTRRLNSVPFCDCYYDWKKLGF
jgi:radical SAM enzyme (TIGR01210 family)